MIKPFQGELLNSYLLRLYICLGDSGSISGLYTNSKGNLRWVTYPKVAAEFVNFFLDYDYKELYEYVSKNTIAHRVSKFSSPLAYIKLLERIFFGLENSIYLDDYPIKTTGSYPLIKYCPECFFEQIKESGVSWFRLEWFESGNKCERHDALLLTDSCRNGCGNTLDKFKAMMSGKCLICGEEVWCCRDVKTLPYNNPSPYRNTNEHVAPCMIWKVKSWAESLYQEAKELAYKMHDISMYEDFPEYFDGGTPPEPLSAREKEILIVKNDLKSLLAVRSNFCLGTYSRFSYDLYEYYESSPFQELSKKLTDNTDIREVYVGGVSYDIKVNLLVSRDFDCSKCHIRYIDCPNSSVEKFPFYK